MDLTKLFQPKSVAIVGASDRNPWSGLVLRALEALAFAGPIHLVNRGGGPALGRSTVSSCRDLEGVDAAFVVVPASALAETIEDMAAAGIRLGVVVTSGFAELGEEGAARQATLFRRARDLGLTLMGPNSLGFANFVDGVSLGAIPIHTPVLPAPRVGLVSQSGATAAMIYAFAHQQNVSMSHIVSMGNEASVDLADVIDFLVLDEATKAIAVFAETIRNPVAFEAAARRANAARKPIVMLKVGVGELSATVAQAHTGALVGDDRVFRAVCDACNIIRVDAMEDLVLTADLLAEMAPIDPARGFALLSISGGACEIVADRGSEIGVPFPQFEPETLAALADVLADFGGAHNPLDVTGAAFQVPEIYSRSIEAIGRDPAFGLVGVVAELPAVPGAASPMSPAVFSEISSGFANGALPGVIIQQILKPITAHGRSVIADYRLPLVTGGLDHAVRAVGGLYAWSRGLGRADLRERPPAKESGQRPAGEQALLTYLEGEGVPVIPREIAQDRAGAVAAARRIGGPVVLKIVSPGISHKTEAGGVLLNLQGDDAIGAGFDRIRARVSAVRPDASFEGMMVCPLRSGGVELIVGVARDPQWGLAIAIGLGGVWTELLNDVSLRLLPVTADDVRAMLAELRAAKLLDGYRGARPADIDRLAQVIVDIGHAAIALGDDLCALEINPLRVAGHEIEALDALAIWAE